MAQGMRIGVQLGQQQAEERFRQQQMAARAAQQAQEQQQQDALMRFKEVQAAKQEQMTARDQALAEQKFSLAASEAAKKHQAFQQYQSAIAGGMDPNDAMLQFGPAMSANTGAAAAIRARTMEQKQPKSWQEVTMPSGLSTLQSSGGDIRFPPRPQRPAATPQPPRVPEGSAFVQATDEVPAHWATPKTAKASGLSDNQTLMELHRNEKDLEKLSSDYSQFDLSEDGKADPKWKDTKKNQFKALKAQADKLRKRIDDLENPPAPKAAPAAQGKRVRVQSPDGKVGSIPADQLDDALAHHYTLVK
jgi:hypothetical protein